MHPKPQKNPRPPNPTPKQKPPKKPQPCTSGFLCDYLQLPNGRCKFVHAEDDLRMAEEYDRIRKRGRTVVVFQGREEKGEKMEKMEKGDLKAVCLVMASLPIEIVEDLGGKKEQMEQSKSDTKEDPKPKYQQGYYYQAKFLSSNHLKKTLQLTLTQKISKYGQVSKQTQLYKNIINPYYIYDKIDHNKNPQILTGTIKNNWERRKVLYNNRGLYKPYYLKEFQERKYALSQGCMVRYVGGNRQENLKVLEVIYDKFKFSGIIQVDKNGIFYVKCRNWRHDQLDLPSIPLQLIDTIPQIQQYLPYSMLKLRKIPKQTVQQLNTSLKKYLIRGTFHSWPQQFPSPIAQLQPEFTPLSQKSLQAAIIYEYMITPTKHSETEKKKSLKLLQEIEKQGVVGKRKLVEEFVVSIDGAGTVCHDDALSVRKLGDGEYQVGIYVSDVDQYVGAGSYLDGEVKKRDKTMYVKGYYTPMFHTPLLKFFSLSSGSNKLAYNLSFNLSQTGLINFKSIKFHQTCIKVQKNYHHSPTLQSLPQLAPLFTVHKIIQNSGLLKNSNLLESESELGSGLGSESVSEIIVDQMMLLSAMIPAFMWKVNCRRIQGCKKVVQEFVDGVVGRLRSLVGDWEKEYKVINQKQKDFNKVSDQRRKLELKIQKQVKLLYKKLKQQQKQSKKKEQATKQQKPERTPKNKQAQNNQSDTAGEDEQSQQTELQLQKSQIPNQEIEQQQQAVINQQKQQVERLKKVKDIINKKIEIKGKDMDSETESSISSESQTELDGEMYGRKMSSAERAMNFMNKVFKILKVDIQWDSKEDIRKMFAEARKFNKSQIFQEYIKRMHIMNHQHFKFILDKKAKERKQQNKKMIESKQPDQQSQTSKRFQYKPKTQQKIQNKNEATGSKKQPTAPQVKEEEKNQQNKKLDQRKVEKIQEIKQVQKQMFVEKKKYRVERDQGKKQKYKQVTKKMEENNKVIEHQEQKRGEKDVKQENMNMNEKQEQSKGKEKQQEKKLQFENKQAEKKEQQKDSKMQRTTNKQGKHQKKLKEKINLQQKQLTHETDQQTQQKSTQPNPQDNPTKQQKPAKIEASYLPPEKVQQIVQKYLLYFRKNQLQFMEVREEKEKEMKQQEAINENELEIQEEVQQDKANLKRMKVEKKRQQLHAVLKALESVDLASLAQKFHISEIFSQNFQQGIFLPASQLNELPQNLKKLYKKKKLAFIKNLLFKQIQKQKIQKKINSKFYQFIKTKNHRNIDKSKANNKKSKDNGQGKDIDRSEQILNQSQMGKILEMKSRKLREFIEFAEIRVESQVELYCYLEVIQTVMRDKYFQKYPEYQLAKDKQQITKAKNKSKTDQIKQEPKKQYKQQPDEKNKEKNACQSIKIEQVHEKQQPNSDLNEKKLEPKDSEHQHLSDKQKQPSCDNPLRKVQQRGQQKAQQQGQQQDQVKVEQVQPSKKKVKQGKKKSKKEIERQIQAKLREQIQAKYEKQIQEFEEKISKQKEALQEIKKQLKQSLKSVDTQYNLLQYMIEKLHKPPKSKKPPKKSQKKPQDPNTDTDAHTHQYLSSIETLCSLVQTYSKKSDYKFSIKKASELQSYLKSQVQVQGQGQVQGKLGKDQLDDIEKVNGEFRDFFREDEKGLKWNNPIRSYQALEVLRLLKDYQWVFNGEISPLDVLLDSKAIKQIKSKLLQFQKQALQKSQQQNQPQKHKQANRELSKLQFFYRIKNQPHKTYTLLNVTSPNQDAAKFVFHPTLGEIEVKDKNFQQRMFEEVEGKIQICCQFPVEVKADLRKNL